MTTQRTLYLIHFDREDGSIIHYLGITRSDRLLIRLGEHARGVGARLTRAMLAKGGTARLARIWRHASYADERRMKTRGHYKTICPVCTTGAPEPRCQENAPIRARFPTTGDTTKRFLGWSDIA